MRSVLLVILSLILTSCGTPLVSEPLPTPISVSLVYPNFLQPTAQRVIVCANQQHTMSVFLTTLPAVGPNMPGAVLQLQLGGAIPDRADAYQIGEDEITFIVNSRNPTGQLSTEQLLAIYTGQQVHWEFADHPMIEVWSYPSGDILRSLLEANLPGDPGLSSRAIIAPDPQVMLQAVADGTDALGYLPSSWVDGLDDEMRERVKVLTLEPKLAESLTQPVLAIVNEPLSPEMQELLGCLQQPED
jgi:hypothetical protein